MVQALQLASVPGLPSLVVADLADYATFAYYAGFTVESTASTATPAWKQVTYIALSKKTMPQVVELCDVFKTESQLYNDGTMEHVLSVSTSWKYCSSSTEVWQCNQGICHTDQASIRLPACLEIRFRCAALENSNYGIPRHSRKDGSMHHRICPG